MKKLIAIVLAVTLLATLSGVALAGNPSGMPNGKHFTLNIIGMQNEKEGMPDDKEGGSVIFVKLGQRGGEKVQTKIMLTAGDSFRVLDKNGTDGEASYQMPSDVATEYTVWIAARGHPDGEADMQLCVYDKATEVWLCGTEGIVRLRGHDSGSGRQKFTNVTRELLFASGKSLFDDDYEGQYWDYKNAGQKLAKLRFYPVTD